MNESNEIIENGSQLSASSVDTTRRNAKRLSVPPNSCSPRRSKRVKTSAKVDQIVGEPESRLESGPDAMGSTISADSTTSEVNDRTNDETVVSNDTQNTGNSDESETQSQETNETSNVCIDLTEDDSVVIENNTESDSEIQCIEVPGIEESELCILRDIKRRRNRFNRIPLRIEQTEQSADVIEIQDSLQNQFLSNSNQSPSVPPVPQASSTPKKIIKCPVCLDEYSMFRISGKQLVSTNCGHLFCDLCIKEVIKTSKSCPNCRKKIATQKSFHPIYI